MKTKKNWGQPLSEQEMKSVKGGHVFSSSECGVRCPACGKDVEISLYSPYIICTNCGNVILAKKEE